MFKLQIKFQYFGSIGSPWTYFRLTEEPRRGVPTSVSNRRGDSGVRTEGWVRLWMSGSVSSSMRSEGLSWTSAPVRVGGGVERKPGSVDPSVGLWDESPSSRTPRWLGNSFVERPSGVRHPHTDLRWEEEGGPDCLGSNVPSWHGRVREGVKGQPDGRSPRKASLTHLHTCRDIGGSGWKVGRRRTQRRNRWRNRGITVDSSLLPECGWHPLCVIGSVPVGVARSLQFIQ